MRLYGEDNNNSNKGLLVANTRLGYVKLKFFTTKIFLQLPEIVRVQDIPRIPPPLCGIGVRPRLSFGDNHIIPAVLSNLKFMAMTNTLKFLRTFTLDEFKEWKGILQIRIIRNEQTGKYFFGYGDKAGAITSKYPAEPLDHPVVSEVISEESGEQFLLLHNAGDNPQFTTVATL